MAYHVLVSLSATMYAGMTYFPLRWHNNCSLNMHNLFPAYSVSAFWLLLFSTSAEVSKEKIYMVLIIDVFLAQFDFHKIVPEGICN